MYSAKMKAVAVPKRLVQKIELIFLGYLVCFLFCLCSLNQRNYCYPVFNPSYAALLSDLQKDRCLADDFLSLVRYYFSLKTLP